LIARGLKVNSINPIIGALRFFYGTTLGRKDIADQLPFARKEDTLPAVAAGLGDRYPKIILQEEPIATLRGDKSGSMS